MLVWFPESIEISLLYGIHHIYITYTSHSHISHRSKSCHWRIIYQLYHGVCLDAPGPELLVYATRATKWTKWTTCFLVFFGWCFILYKYSILMVCTMNFSYFSRCFCFRQFEARMVQALWLWSVLCDRSKTLQSEQYRDVSPSGLQQWEMSLDQTGSKAVEQPQRMWRPQAVAGLQISSRNRQISLLFGHCAHPHWHHHLLQSLPIGRPWWREWWWWWWWWWWSWWWWMMWACNDCNGVYGMMDDDPSPWPQVDRHRICAGEWWFPTPLLPRRLRTKDFQNGEFRRELENRLQAKEIICIVKSQILCTKAHAVQSLFSRSTSHGLLKWRKSQVSWPGAERHVHSHVAVLSVSCRCP